MSAGEPGAAYCRGSAFGGRLRTPGSSRREYFDCHILCRPGEVSEWLKEHAWKACVPKRYRGFESLPLRQSPRLVSHPPQGLVRVHDMGTDLFSTEAR